MSRATVRTVAKAQTATTTTSTELSREGDATALQAELKRRIAAKSDKPAGSIREALTRWLDEPL